MYFHKIAAALGMQSIVAVSSIKQMLMALGIPGIRAVSINNRNMATWVLDKTRVSRILGDPRGEWLSRLCCCTVVLCCRCAMLPVCCGYANLLMHDQIMGRQMDPW